MVLADAADRLAQEVAEMPGPDAKASRTAEGGERRPRGRSGGAAASAGS